MRSLYSTRKDPKVKKFIFNILRRLPLKTRAITELSQDSDWRTRWRTAIALTASTEPQAKQLLAQLQQDENYRVVAAITTS